MGWLMALTGAICCVALGWLAARGLRNREKSVQGWERAFLQMEGALKTGGVPLPGLLKAGNLPCLDEGADLLARQPALSPQAWFSLLPRDPSLTDGEWAVVEDALLGLFSPSPLIQLQQLSYARQQWARFSALCRESAEKNIRLYQALGWLSGAAVFILMC